MIHEFVEKIIVHEAEGYRSERTQKADIYLNFIGKYEVPVTEPTPEEIAAAEKLKHQQERKRVNYARYVEKRQEIMAQEQKNMD